MKKNIDEFRTKKFFPEAEWKERGLNPSSDETIEAMHKEMIQFLAFLDDRILTNESKDESKILIQKYLDDWDSYDFDTEETEYIVDEMFRVIRKLGFEPEDFFI